MIKKKYEDRDRLIYYCGLCGEILDETEDVSYGSTDGSEVWEIELQSRHKRDCPKIKEEAKDMAEVARSWGHDVTWEEIWEDLVS